MEKYSGTEHTESTLKNIRSYKEGDAKEIKVKIFLTVLSICNLQVRKYSKRQQTRTNYIN